MKYDRNRLSFLIDILVTGMHLPIVLVILIAGEFRRLKRLLTKKKPKSHTPWEHCIFFGVPYEGGGLKNLVDGKVYRPQQECLCDQAIAEAENE